MKSLVFLFACLALVLSSCGGTSPDTGKPLSTIKREAGGIFIEGEAGGDAETLNWILASDASSFGYAGHTIDSLATYDNDWKVVLRHLAKPVEISPDGLTYTMTIRSDLKWTDGTKVTSEDYVYTLKNLMFSDWLNYPYKSDFQEEVEGELVFVEPAVVNETTFTIKRKTVDPEFADNAIYSLTPYPKHIAMKYEGDVKAFTEAPEFNNLSYTGNLGPYRFKEWIREDKYIVERNPDFYLGKDDGSPFFEEYVTKLFGNTTAVLAALEAGDIHNAGIDPENVAKFKDMPGINVYTNPTRSYYVMPFNMRNNGWEGLKNQKVRQAIAMSVNKKLMIDQIMNGFAEPAFSFIPKPSPWYTEEGVPKYGWEELYSKEKARELLLQAGYGVKNSDGSIKVQGKDGKPIKLTIVTTPGSTTAENTTLFVKQELSDIGIELEIKQVPWPTLLRNYVQNTVSGSDQQPNNNNGPDAVSEDAWDLILMVFSTHPIAPSGTEVFFGTEGGLNYFNYSNTRVDELFRKAKTKEALEKTAREKIYAEISLLIAEDQPVLFLVYPMSNVGLKDTVEGIDEGMRMGWNYHLWYFGKP